jgi:hypothetical protein
VGAAHNKRAPPPPPRSRASTIQQHRPMTPADCCQEEGGEGRLRQLESGGGKACTGTTVASAAGGTAGAVHTRVAVRTKNPRPWRLTSLRRPWTTILDPLKTAATAWSASGDQISRLNLRRGRPAGVGCLQETPAALDPVGTICGSLCQRGGAYEQGSAGAGLELPRGAPMRLFLALGAGAGGDREAGGGDDAVADAARHQVPADVARQHDWRAGAGA